MAKLFREEDLGDAGRELVQQARARTATIRAMSGSDLLVIPEETFTENVFVLETAANLARVRTDRLPNGGLPEDWQHPAWPWLSHLMPDDLDTFIEEVGAALLEAAGNGQVDDLKHLLHEWKITALSWSDPLTREVWSEPLRLDDFVEVQRPE